MYINHTLTLVSNADHAADLKGSRWHVMFGRLSLHWLDSYEACRHRGWGWGKGRDGFGWGVMAAGT